MFNIIFSEKDIAGMNIKESLSKIVPQFKKKVILHTIKKDTIYYDEANNLEGYIIFATRHQSKSGEKTLSLHFTGNFTKAEYGGKEKEFSLAPALLLKNAYNNLLSFGKGLGFEITMEATHHGPLLKKPCFFIEIGSTEQEWRNKQCGEVIAKTIIKTINEHIENIEKPIETGIGFGGMHYCHNFNKILVKSDYAIGHICPKYNIPYLDEETIIKMVNTTLPKPKIAFLDWKGISGNDKENLVKMLQKIGLEIKKTKDF